MDKYLIELNLKSNNGEKCWYIIQNHGKLMDNWSEVLPVSIFRHWVNELTAITTTDYSVCQEKIHTRKTTKTCSCTTARKKYAKKYIDPGTTENQRQLVTATCRITMKYIWS